MKGIMIIETYDFLIRALRCPQPRISPSLINHCRSEHERAQQTRLIFQTDDPEILRKGELARDVAKQLLEIECGWLQIAELLEEEISR